MKNQRQCEEILRYVVRDHIRNLHIMRTLEQHSRSYERICAQIGICELMETVPSELSQEMRNAVDAAYKNAIVNFRLPGEAGQKGKEIWEIISSSERLCTRQYTVQCRGFLMKVYWKRPLPAATETLNF